MIFGASLSEPHTSVTSLRARAPVCVGIEGTNDEEGESSGVVAGDFDMGTQQVSGVICARTETEGKGAGYLFCSPEVPGAGGLRMLNNNTLTLDNGGGSSCTQVHITGRTRELSHDG